MCKIIESSTNNKTEKNNKTILIISIIFALVGLLSPLAVVGLYNIAINFPYIKSFFSIGMSKMGLLGDWLGASAPFLSLSAFFIMYLAFFYQKRQLDLQKDQVDLQGETIKKQQFENNYFNIINCYYRIIDTLYHQEEANEKVKDKKVINGREVFKYFFEDLQGAYDRNNKATDKIQLKKWYDDIKEKYALNHYLNCIKEIIKYINTDNIMKTEEKSFYLNLLAIQMDVYETTFLFFTAITQEGFQWIKTKDQLGILQNIELNQTNIQNINDNYISYFNQL
jgi:hypothetical protein